MCENDVDIICLTKSVLIGNDATLPYWCGPQATVSGWVAPLLVVVDVGEKASALIPVHVFLRLAAP